MTWRALRSFQPGDVVRLDGSDELVEIIRQGDMGTTVRPVKGQSKDFVGFDQRAGENKRVAFTSKAPTQVYASSAEAELVRGADA